LLILELEEFENVVAQTVEELPEEFRLQLDNVEFIVEEWPTPSQLRSVYAHPGVTLFGLYQGIPKTKRGSNYSAVLPDRITIFAGPIAYFYPNVEDIKKQIKQTVLHEIGHYFGMSEKAIRDAQRDMD
jgi:predicted Zn-dependent protease with MMP-like domain